MAGHPAQATDHDIKKKKGVGLTGLMLGDCIVTLLWVLASSCFAEVSEYLAEHTGLDELLLGIAVLVAALVVFGPLCDYFGGALVNPVNSIALICSGKDNVATHLIRMCGQLAGALAGTMAARVLLPEGLQSKFHTLSGGIRDGVAFEYGFACEGTMSLVLNYVFLASIEAESSLLTTWVPMVSTVVLCWIGYFFTGPSLNPFVSFSWHLHYRTQDTLEHYLVFWSAPILGAVAAGLAFRIRRAPGRKAARRARTAAAAAAAVARRKKRD